MLQSFGGEKIESEICQDKKELLESSDMNGLINDAGNPGEYISASYQGNNYNTLDGQKVYQANEVKVPIFVDESDVPGADLL